MYPPVIPRLRCPLCHGSLIEDASGSGRALRCANRHSFDIAKQGYVNLAYPAPAYSGDSAEMVEARVQFLSAGHYRFIADAVVAAAAVAPSPDAGLVVEAGAGTGYYISTVLNSIPCSAGLALDVSKAAIRRAAKAHPHCSAALCDVWRELPVADGAATLILSIFAPRNASEFRRILAPDGILIVVTPTVSHLAELVEPLGLLSVDASKEESVATSLEAGFERQSHERHELSLHLSHKEVAPLVSMGPSTRHISSAELQQRISALAKTTTVAASVDVHTYRVRR